MREKDMTSAFELAALVQAIKLTKNAYIKTKDKRLAAAALVLTELALGESDEMLQMQGADKNGS